ncbi:hypothetical protein E2C01_018822 [Portunus trituberculatus]|uniref:Uncharacterized protein n=1 Tax=Portunus trituberculatus TaxID=210409 RepID=A0A5B7DX80_PORTR|nr:hypothetical protein [Portunus trituberculatus]
MDTGITQIL